MASAPKVGPTTAPAGASAVSGWRGAGRRYSLDSPLDGSGGVDSFGVQGSWHPGDDDRHGQGYFFFGQYPEKEDQDPPLFTPFMALRASGFAAVEPLSDIRSQQPVFSADLIRGVGIYDFNLKVIAGTWATHGALLNRYG